MLKVTELEQKVLLNIVKSEYMDGVGEQMIGWAVWAFTATNEDKQLAGALGSLVKKGFVFSAEWDTDTVCGLTELGYNYLKDNYLL